MKKHYNIKFRKHNDIVLEINQIDDNINKMQNEIVKISFKRKTIISFIDNDFYNQFKIMFTRIHKDLADFIFEFFGFRANNLESIKVNIIILT